MRNWKMPEGKGNREAGDTEKNEYGKQTDVHLPTQLVQTQ